MSRHRGYTIRPTPRRCGIACVYVPQAAAWIEQLSREGTTAGCGSGKYCPEGAVTRAQMAVFLAKTFNLPLAPPGRTR